MRLEISREHLRRVGYHKRERRSRFISGRISGRRSKVGRIFGRVPGAVRPYKANSNVLGNFRRVPGPLGPIRQIPGLPRGSTRTRTRARAHAQVRARRHERAGTSASGHERERARAGEGRVWCLVSGASSRRASSRAGRRAVGRRAVDEPPGRRAVGRRAVRRRAARATSRPGDEPPGRCRFVSHYPTSGEGGEPATRATGKPRQRGLGVRRCPDPKKLRRGFLGALRGSEGWTQNGPAGEAGPLFRGLGRGFSLPSH
jgi:hypothetical protein